MALKALSQFERFDLASFLSGKQLIYIKATSWRNEKENVGSKVVVQIIEDKTNYGRPDISNFGEQLTIKVRDVSPDAFDKLKPLRTEIFVKNVERASVFGEFRNQLSIIGTIAVAENATK